MKSLKDFIGETLIIEKFGSSKIEKLVTRISSDDEFWLHIKRELMWDKISDNDVEIMTPNDVLKITKNDPDNNFYCIWVSKDNEIIGRSIGLDLFSIFANVATLLGLTRKAKIEEVYVIRNWEQFSTKDLKEKRKEMKKGALALKSDEEILEENQYRYKKLIEILKYKNLKEATDLDKLYDKITSNLNIALMALRHNESFANEYNWISGKTEIEEFMEDYARIFNEITQVKKYMKGKNQSVAFADAEWWLERFNAKDIDDIIEPWYNDKTFFERIGKAIGRLQRLNKDVENFIKRVSDIKDDVDF